MSFKTTIPVLFFLALAAPILAADAAEKKPEGWVFNGSVRARAEAWDWFDTAAPGAGKEDDYTFFGSIVRLSGTKTGPRHDWTLEAAIPTLLGLPEDAVAPGAQGQLGQGGSYRAANGGQNLSVLLKQAHVTMKGREGRKMKVGRFEFADGLECLTGDATLDWLKKERIGHRLIGTFGFTHVGRSFDGAQFSIDRPDTLFTVVGARPTQGVFDLDANEPIDDVNLQYTSLTFRDSDKLQDGRIFAMRYSDERALLKSDNRPLAARTIDRTPVEIYTFGGDWMRKAGDFDLLAWGVFQTGDWGSLEHEAWAFDAEVGHHFGGKHDPWLRAGYTASSGDTSAADGRHETFFQVLPTPRIYARFPFYNMMNTQDLYAQLLFKPSKKTGARIEYHVLDLAESADLWYLGGGAFQRETFGYAGRPSGGSTELANVLDAALDFKWDADTNLTLYAARAFGGNTVTAIYPAGDDASYFYAEVTRKF